MQVRLILTILIMLNTKLHSLITDICCKAQPKQKPNPSWAVLVLNPTSPTTHPPNHPADQKSMRLVLLSQAYKTKIISLYGFEHRKRYKSKIVYIF